MRVKNFLYDSISSDQFGFLQGRQICDTLGMEKEGMHTIKKKGYQL
jgi:hypothetical protein